MANKDRLLFLMKTLQEQSDEKQWISSIESTGIKKKQYGSRSKSGKLSGTYRQQYHRALSAIMSFALKSDVLRVVPKIVPKPL